MIRVAQSLLPLILVVATVLSGCPLAPSTEQPTGDAVVLTREHLATYEAGGTIDITVEISVGEGVDLSAIAFVESAPPGWVYISSSNVFNALPAIRPQQGAEGNLTFVWIQPPYFPYTFTYTMGIPLSASGPATFRGHVEYRQGAGDGEMTATLRSTLLDR